MENKKVYLVEWGYLLSKDNIEYNFYSNVYGYKTSCYD